MAQNEYDLEGVLEKCRKAASDGYKIASEHTAYIKDTLQDAEKEVQATLDDFKKSQVYDSGVTDKLCGQLEEIKSRFGMLSDAFNDDLESIEQNISNSSHGRLRSGPGSAQGPEWLSRHLELDFLFSCRLNHSRKKRSCLKNSRRAGRISEASSSGGAMGLSAAAEPLSAKT